MSTLISTLMHILLTFKSTSKSTLEGRLMNYNNPKIICPLEHTKVETNTSLTPRSIPFVVVDNKGDP